mgnify:CR=1 FL=1
MSIFFSGSGAVGIAHLDGVGTEEGVQSMVQKVQQLALGYPEGRLELQMIGGFTNNRRNYSEELFGSIMRKYSYLSPRQKKKKRKKIGEREKKTG